MKQKTFHQKFLLLLFLVFLHSGQLHSQCTDLTQTTPPIGKLDYTMWSSPVTGFTLESLSPLTLSDKYHVFDPMQNNWVSVDKSTVMQPGVGYLVRAPNNYPSCNGCPLLTYTAPFSGTPNSGTITVPIAVGSNSSFNLIGNPYCSTIAADCLIRDTDNQTSIGGTLYFWSHNIPIDWTDATTNPENPQVDGNYNYNSSSFAMYNLLGGVAAGYTANGSAFLTLDRPDGYIARGQGFLINGLSNGSTAYFKESMITNIAAHFFRIGSPDVNIPPPGGCDVDKHRLWIQIRMGTLFRETLVGYAQATDGATTGPNLDRNFDGIQMPLSTGQPYINIYSLSPNSTAKLSIQGRSLSVPFNVNDVIQLGYDCNISGDATITGSDFDGLFVNQDYWLKDNAFGTYHHIKTTPYTFQTTANPTDANTRFQIVFRIPNTPVIIPRDVACGGTLPTIWSVLQAYPYVIGGTYRYLVRDLDTGILYGPFSGVGTYSYTFNLNKVGLHFGGHYEVSVATFQIDGNWVYGTPCEVRTPALPPTYSACSNQTPIPVSSYNSYFINATDNYTFFSLTKGSIYHYRVTNMTTGIISIVQKDWTSPTLPYRLNFNDLNSIIYSSPIQTPQIGVTYKVETDIFWNGAWIGYGSPCFYTIIAAKTSAPDTFSAVVFPSPSENSFKFAVTTDSNEMIDTVVYDMTGRNIESYRLSSNELSNLEVGNQFPAGIYIIVIKQGKNIEKLRVIKK